MSIRSRLLLVALLATLLPLGLEVARFVQDRDEAIAAEMARLGILAQRRAEAIAEQIEGTAQLHFGLARAQELHAGDRDACSAFLATALDRHPQYTGILTITPDGQLFCDSLRTGRELDLRDRAYFQAALEVRDRVVLEPAIGRLTGLAVLQIAYPVRAVDGALQFVLLASLDLGSQAEVGQTTIPDAGLLLLDRRGTLLAASRPDLAGGSPGDSVADSALFAFASSPDQRATEIPGGDGSVRVWAKADLAVTSDAGVLVLAAAPRASIVAPADRRLLENLALLLGFASCVLVAVWLVSELVIRRQVGRIARLGERLAAGDLTARIEPPLPSGELGALMATLNGAAASLERQRADIADLNDRLHQAQRLEAIGQLTGGVAHDFNNLLTVVMGNAELLADDETASSDQQELARTIVTAAQSGAQLTQHLLAFARRQALAPTVIDVNALVGALDPILRRTLGEHIAIVLVRGGGLWPAFADRAQLENALINLCVNARDAMPRGGRLTVETANVRLDEDYAARNVDVTPGQYVMVAVSDTGAGIGPEQLPHVFEPFYTTKELGHGTGLGLAMVYGFIKQSSGHVSIYSEPGEGTTVKLYLPRADVRAEVVEAPAAKGAVAGGTETILVVEDDELVRRFGAGQLREFGYRVLEAPDGPAALAVLERHPEIDLLFTDVVIPGGMNGRELADAARALRPDLRVLYTSGYTQNAIVHHGRLDPGARLLAKPYRRTDLDRAIRDALDAQPERPNGH